MLLQIVPDGYQGVKYLMNYIVNIADIEQALRQLGGEAMVKKIQDKILADHCGKTTPANYQSNRSFRQTVQRKIEDYCPDAKGFDKSKKEAKFFRIARGRYQIAPNEGKKSTKFLWMNVGLDGDGMDVDKFIWAPQSVENLADQGLPGKGLIKGYSVHWRNVDDVRAGDIIFGNYDQRILFVAVAGSNAKASRRPVIENFKTGNDLGFEVDVQIFPLTAPLPIDVDVKEAFDRRYNEMCTPRIFNASGEVFHGHMAVLPDAAGVELLRLVGDVEIDAVEASDRLRERKKTELACNADLWDRPPSRRSGKHVLVKGTFAKS